MTDPHALLTSPHGRIGRQSYWTIIAALVAVSMVVSLIPFFGSLASLILLWPFGCVVAKRLHDAGRRAWAVPVIAALSVAAAGLSFTATMMATQPGSIVAAFGLAAPALMLSGVSMLASLALVLMAGLAPGAADANRFGDPELEPITPAQLLRHVRL